MVRVYKLSPDQILDMPFDLLAAMADGQSQTIEFDNYEQLKAWQKTVKK